MLPAEKSMSALSIAGRRSSMWRTDRTCASSKKGIIAYVPACYPRARHFSDAQGQHPATRHRRMHEAWSRTEPTMSGASWKPLLPKRHIGRPRKDHRAILNGILWLARTERFGPWRTRGAARGLEGRGPQYAWPAG